MTRGEYEAKLAEMDRLVNDCDVPLMPERIWSLLAELTRVPHRFAETEPAGMPRTGTRLG